MPIDQSGAEALIRRLRNQADSLEAAAEWFKECKVLRLERLPTGFIAALRAGAEMLRAAALSGGARPQEQSPTSLQRQMNLMAIRRWVDEGFAKMEGYYGHPAPNGFAGEAAAAVWTHVQAILEAAGARPPEPADKEYGKDPIAEILEKIHRARVGCPHCHLPPVLPDICTPELNAVIEENIARDWDLYHHGYNLGKRVAVDVEGTNACEARPQDFWSDQAQTLSRKIREAAGTMQANPATTIDEDVALLRSLARPPEPADALRAVAQSLVDFQTLYQQMAWDDMPGNAHYAGMLIKIVEAARSALWESR